MLESFRGAVAEARRNGDLYFAALLSEDYILKVLGDARRAWHGWIYTPAVTVWMFLSQCLSADHSCRDVVARLIAWRTAQGLRPCSAKTGAYCIARGHLREATCRRMVRETGCQLEQDSPPEWQWHNRPVRVVDGATVTMPDTTENQAAYPQIRRQKPGCGFPIARIVVVFSLAVGTVLDAAIGKYEGKQTGENSMFRSLQDGLLTEGDIVLADRYFSGWFDIARLLHRGVDVLVRKHQLRKTDFRQGKRLGVDDHIVFVPKPSRPPWLAPDDYRMLPEALTLREVCVRVKQKGFRTKKLVVVTTLLDEHQYTSGEIAKLYRRRWQAELHLRSLKTVLQMDHLRCKTPARVRTEFWMHLLGYNLIRHVMTLAAVQSNQSPWQISFKGALQTLNQFLPLLWSHHPFKENQWYDALLNAIATHLVGNRPDRYEPRLIKRRPKKYKYFREPRQNYRNRLAKIT